ncbi:venom serine protease Bi-VSP-like isoform X1 [Drosophila nasuta]|uniref:venom serine protease Bi-VSP-like isoform X1 n=1 Tax=Drosophila nasuta TaxID=42062 RepID=UPI00295E4D34|nr:venom serine protease Bi-VSP-like isoform X1 [Drosophila nasuta]
MKSVPSAVITLVLVCFATPTRGQFNFNRQVRQNCITPENYYGSCVALSYCPQVAEVFQLTDRRTAENYVFALQRSCGTRNINRDPVVCCTRPISAPVTERPTNPFLPPTDGGFVGPQPVPTSAPNNNPFFRSTTQRPTTAAPTTSAPVTSAPIVEQRGTSCRIPPNKLGECVDIKSCQPILSELLVKRNDPEFAKYVKASNLICGQIGTNVCCPTGQTEATRAPIKPKNSDAIPRSLFTVEDGCGYTLTTNKKIVGGVVSKKGAWPWIALLGYDDGSSSPFKCGGTLITARHVVTAAHCIREDLTFVRLGEHDLSDDTEAGHVDINIAKKVSHPEYNRRNGRSDIAMLYLERNVELTSLILPICMPSTPSLRAKSYVGTLPFVIGWGKTQEGGESATVLNELMIPVMDNEVCRSSYEKLNRYFSEDQFDKAVLCAGVLSGGKDTCQGDSGGPLMTSEGGGVQMRFYLIGIVSYGVGCARPEVPGVYTSVQYFMDWIIEKVQDTP